MPDMFSDFLFPYFYILCVWPKISAPLGVCRPYTPWPYRSLWMWGWHRPAGWEGVSAVLPWHWSIIMWQPNCLFILCCDMLGAVLSNSCRWWGAHQLLPSELRIQSRWLKRTSLVWPIATWKTWFSIIIPFPHSTSATQPPDFSFSFFKPFSWHYLCLDVSSKSMLECCQRRLPRPLSNLVPLAHLTPSFTFFYPILVIGTSNYITHFFVCIFAVCLPDYSARVWSL